MPGKSTILPRAAHQALSDYARRNRYPTPSAVVAALVKHHEGEIRAEIERWNAHDLDLALRDQPPREFNGERVPHTGGKPVQIGLPDHVDDLIRDLAAARKEFSTKTLVDLLRYWTIVDLPPTVRRGPGPRKPVNIPTEVHAKLKKAATAAGTTMEQLASTAIETHLRRLDPAQSATHQAT